MSSPSCPLHRRGIQVAALGIDLGALVQQISAGSHVRVDGRPVQRGDVLGVAVGNGRLAGLDEVLNSLDVSPLRSDEDAHLARVSRRC